MNPTFRKVALIAAVLGFAVSVLVAACGDDDEEATPPTTAAPTTAATMTQPPPPTTAPPTETQTTETATVPPGDEVQTIRIAVEGGRPPGGIARPSVGVGDEVVILVTSDVVDHVHLHGYDLVADAGPDTTARIEFTADVPGRFEIELEERGVQIAELTVEP